MKNSELHSLFQRMHNTATKDLSALNEVYNLVMVEKKYELAVDVVKAKSFLFEVQDALEKAMEKVK